MTPYRWRIELFGSLCLLREDHGVETLPPSKVGGLLAYLACQPERTHTRQELAAFFWPEADSGTGRTRLRQHLTALRRQLEPEGVSPESVLRANRDEIVLEPSAFTTDVADFEETLRRAERTSDPAERLALLDRAVGFYRGEFLPGYYEHWILGERERLKERAGGALRELASACEEAQDPARSIGYLQRLVAVEPLCEENHAALMRLLIAAHQPAAAHHQYKTLQRLLKTGLDADPSEATRALLRGLPSEVSGVQNVPVSKSAASLEGAASSAPTPGGLADAIPPEDVLRSVSVEASLPAVAAAPEASTQKSSFAQSPSSAQEAQPVVPVSAVSTSTPRRRVHYRLRLLVALSLLLLLTGLIGWLFSLPDNNPAHKNFSPAALKSGKQDELWIRRYEPKPGDKDSEPKDIVTDKAGNVYVTGFIDTEKRDVDYITLKYAPDGRLLWERRYNGTGNNFDRAGILSVDADENVYVTGSSFGQSGEGPDKYKEADLVTVKYDAKGNKVGEDRFDGLGHGEDGLSRSALDGKGHYYVFGTTWDGVLPYGRDGHCCVLIQYDKNLHARKTYRYHDPNGGPAISADMTIDPEGNVYALCICSSRYVILKYNANNNLIVSQTYRQGNDTRVTPCRLLRDSAGSLYIVSQVTSDRHRPGQEAYAVQVLKYDRDLHYQWGNIYWDLSYAWHNSHIQTAQNFRCANAAIGRKIYIAGAMESDGNPCVQGLMVIQADSGAGSVLPFSGRSKSEGPRVDQVAWALAIDHRGQVHVTGVGHFEDTESVTAPLDTTEVTTTTYTSLCELLAVHRYAGAQLLHSLGGRAVTVDAQDNVLVAGQTFGGKTQDLVVLKYPP